MLTVIMQLKPNAQKDIYNMDVPTDCNLQLLFVRSSEPIEKDAGTLPPNADLIITNVDNLVANYEKAMRYARYNWIALIGPDVYPGKDTIRHLVRLIKDSQPNIGGFVGVTGSSKNHKFDVRDFLCINKKAHTAINGFITSANEPDFMESFDSLSERLGENNLLLKKDVRLKFHKRDRVVLADIKNEKPEPFILEAETDNLFLYNESAKLKKALAAEEQKRLGLENSLTDISVTHANKVKELECLIRLLKEENASLKASNLSSQDSKSRLDLECKELIETVAKLEEQIKVLQLNLDVARHRVIEEPRVERREIWWKPWANRNR